VAQLPGSGEVISGIGKFRPLVLKRKLVKFAREAFLTQSMQFLEVAQLLQLSFGGVAGFLATTM
jgi:hypothetical protein